MRTQGVKCLIELVLVGAEISIDSSRWTSDRTELSRSMMDTALLFPWFSFVSLIRGVSFFCVFRHEGPANDVFFSFCSFWITKGTKLFVVRSDEKFLTASTRSLSFTTRKWAKPNFKKCETSLPELLIYSWANISTNNPNMTRVIESLRGLLPTFSCLFRSAESWAWSSILTAQRFNCYQPPNIFCYAIVMKQLYNLANTKLICYKFQVALLA